MSKNWYDDVVTISVKNKTKNQYLPLLSPLVQPLPPPPWLSEGDMEAARPC